MARGSKKWLDQIIDKLGARFSNVPRENWNALSLLNNGAAGQRAVFDQHSSDDKLALLETVLELAGFQQPEDPVAKKFHDALMGYYAQNHESLPDLHKWSKNYHKSPHLIGAPENRIPLDQIVKTKKGTVRNPVHSLYRLLRGNARLNESKDFMSVMPNIYDAQVTTALTKLAKNGHIKYDPKSGFMLIPRDTIRQIDPYYERYQETLKALQQAINEDHSLANRVMTSVSNARDNEEARAAERSTFSYTNRPEEEQIAKYKDLAKAFMQDQMRRNMPRIAEDIPFEERNRLLALQQDRLQNISDTDIEDGLRAIYNRTYIEPSEAVWPMNPTNPMMRLASLFSEKGLRGLLNNPKRALKVAQISELLEDKWDEINDFERTWNYHPRDNDRQIPLNIFYAMPENAVDRRVHYPGGPWKQGDLQSLNNYDAFRRQLDDRERIVERNNTQARERIIQYIQAHPELQQIAARNAADHQQRLQLQDMRGIGYTQNAEDEEEERIINGLGRQLKGNYSEIAKTLLNQPRLVELGKRPYKYSKGIMDAIGEAPVTMDEHPGWRLAENRLDLYNRSLHHNICIGMPVMQYHDKALAKKSLLFFSGDHTDPNSEAGEVALYIDPKTHKIIKTAIVQVHGIHNAPGTKLGTQNLKYIADALVGKSVDDTNNIVEEEGVEYKEEHAPAQQEDPDLPQTPGDVYIGFVQAYANDHDYRGDIADYDDDEAYNYAHNMMGHVGYHMDDDGNYLERGDPEYDDFDEDGNRVNDDGDEGEFDEDDEGYAEGGFVEPTGNPAYRRLLELLLEDGMTKPKTALSAVMRRF